jgi:AmmeMemoRadiSam system protein A
LGPEPRRQLLEVARRAIEFGLERGQPLEVVAADFALPIQEPRATFVTLRRGGDLRGCIGSLEVKRPLVCDVAHNAFSSAFRDPRFSPLTTAELSGLEIQISVLGPLEPLEVSSEEQLLTVLRPKLDGLILRDGRREATFLPSVWEGLPDPQSFVRELKLKAGLPADHWSDELQALRYGVESIP